MKTLSERLKEARVEAKLSQGALGKLAQCGQSTIASIERGRNQGSTLIPRLAEVLGISALWLAEGRGQKRAGGADSPTETLQSFDPLSERKSQKPLFCQDRQGDYHVHHVPLIQWEDAPMIHEHFAEIRDSQTVAFHGSPGGRRLIAVRQDDDSMFDGGASSFPPGTEYIIDLDLKPEPNDFVLIIAGSRGYLRQLISDVAGWKLRPLNKAQFATIDHDPSAVNGVLIDAKLPIFRRPSPFGKTSLNK